ncbi:MAG: hypothetical protein KKA84_11840 [Bacteroidetes bacterium]|nr:hypothetical protein [Bacteroidota bacterium]
MYYLISILLLLNLSFQSSAQNLLGCVQNALGNSDLCFISTPFSIFSNPSASTNCDAYSLGIYFSPKPFGLSELSTKGTSITIPVNYGVAGFGYSITGFELFKEQKMVVSFANSINEIFTVGISAFYQNVSITNYGSDGTIVFLIGSVFSINPDLRLAFTIYNPASATYGNIPDQIPVVLNFGVSYRISEIASVYINNSKELNQNNNLCFGISASPIEWVNFYLGYKSLMNSYSAGISFKQSMFEVSYATNSHPELGLTHQFGLGFRIK